MRNPAPIAARVPLLVLLALFAALLAGCGSDSDATSGDERKVSSKETSVDDTDELVPTVEAELDLLLTGVGGKESLGIQPPAVMKCTKSIPATCTGSVTCPSAREDKLELCAWLARPDIRELFLPSSTADERQVCTQQFGGSARAKVTGTLDGEPVDVEFSRQDGCAIAEYELAAPLWTGEFPPAEPPTAPAGGPAFGACPALPADTPASNAPGTAEGSAADRECATPATPAPPKTAPPTPEPEVISDPPEAFEQ